MPRSHKIETAVLAQAMKEFDGDYSKVAEHFDTTAKKIRERVYHDPQLYAIWVDSGTKEKKPDAIELMERQHEEDDDKGTRLLQALDKNSRYIFNNELESILTNQDNVQKLKIFEDFDDSVGLLMAEALRITQKVNIRQNMSLFEVTEALKVALDDNQMDPEERILQTRLFLQATEQQGKFYDRLLKGLEFQLKLANEKDKRETKGKVGFQALKDKKKIEQETENRP
tara:strand:+ start:13386 stop:14066 length:681 start_codon:yes stop_codon:yes gene_type:complete